MHLLALEWEMLSVVELIKNKYIYLQNIIIYYNNYLSNINRILYMFFCVPVIVS